jgi:hypothetical protein
MKKIVLALSIFLAIGLVGAFRARAFRIQTSELPPPKVDKQAERSAARSIQRGLGDGHKKISVEVLEAKNSIEKRIEPGLPVLVPHGPAFNLETYLNNRTCAADVIVVGTVKTKKSQLTEDETFIFSNYRLDVGEVIKNGTTQPLQSNVGSFDVTRAGGEIDIQGHRVRAILEAAQPLEEGNSYLLFLTFLPEDKIFAANGLTYLLKDGEIAKLTTAALPKQLDSGNDASDFIREVRVAAAKPCQLEGGQQ